MGDIPLYKSSVDLGASPKTKSHGSLQATVSERPVAQHNQQVHPARAGEVSIQSSSAAKQCLSLFTD